MHPDYTNARYYGQQCTVLSVLYTVARCTPVPARHVTSLWSWLFTDNFNLFTYTWLFRVGVKVFAKVTETDHTYVDMLRANHPSKLSSTPISVPWRPPSLQELLGLEQFAETSFKRQSLIWRQCQKSCFLLKEKSIMMEHHSVWVERRD